MNLKKYLTKVPPLTNKTIVITGTTSGLGFALTELLLAKGAHVVLANRPSSRVVAMLTLLREKHKECMITTLNFDQSDTVMIDQFVAELKSLNLRLDGFVFNAGVYLPAEHLQTNKGLPLTFGVNYFGNYYLTKKLQENGIVTNNTRLVYTTSIAAAKALRESDVHKLFTDGNFPRHKQYQLAKTALNIYVSALMEEADGNVYLYHPGVSSTNIVRFKMRTFTAFAKFVMKVIFPNAHKAALGALLALTTPEKGTNKIIAPGGFLNISGKPKLKHLHIQKNASAELLFALTEEKCISND